MALSPLAAANSLDPERQEALPCDRPSTSLEGLTRR